MQNYFTRRSLMLGGMLLATGLGQSAWAAGFPERPVTVVVPYSPAGGVDIVTRLVTTPRSLPLEEPFSVTAMVL